MVMYITIAVDRHRRPDRRPRTFRTRLVCIGRAEGRTSDVPDKHDMPDVVERTVEGRDEKTPVYLQIGVLGIVALAVVAVLAIVFPLYYAFGGN
jgi:hypothetical protein